MKNDTLRGRFAARYRTLFFGAGLPYYCMGLAGVQGVPPADGMGHADLYGPVRLFGRCFGSFARMCQRGKAGVSWSTALSRPSRFAVRSKPCGKSSAETRVFGIAERINEDVE